MAAATSATRVDAAAAAAAAPVPESPPPELPAPTDYFFGGVSTFAEQLDSEPQGVAVPQKTLAQFALRCCQKPSLQYSATAAILSARLCRTITLGRLCCRTPGSGTLLPGAFATLPWAAST